MTAVSLGAAFSQTAERAEEDKGSRLECDAYTLEEIAPGMKYTEVEALLKARSPKPRSVGRLRAYDAVVGWRAVHSWDVEDGTLEVWYDNRKANRKTNPTAVVVRLLARDVSANELWKAMFDRFGPMSNWKREDCNINGVVGLDRNRPHTTLSLLSWEGASSEAED